MAADLHVCLALQVHSESWDPNQSGALVLSGLGRRISTAESLHRRI